MEHKGTENLIPLGENSKLSKEQQREIRSKGGKASAASKKRKKSMKEVAQLLLSLKLPEDSNLGQELKDIGIEDDEINYQMAIVYTLIQRARLDGDVKAIQALIDLSGNNTHFNESQKERKREFKQKMDLAQKEYELHKQKVEKDDW